MAPTEEELDAMTHAEAETAEEGSLEAEIAAHAEAETAEEGSLEAEIAAHAAAEGDPTEPAPDAGEGTKKDEKKKKPRGRRPRRRRAESEEDMGKGKKTAGPYDEMTQEERLAYISNLAEVEIRLLRRDKFTGRTDSMGKWPARPPSDVFDAENWIREWSGGGQYTMSVYDPRDRVHPVVNLSFNLPGDELEPLDVRQKKAAQADAVQQVAPTPSQGVQPMSQPQPPTPPGVMPNPAPQVDAWGRPQQPAQPDAFGRQPYNPMGGRPGPGRFGTPVGPAGPGGWDDRLGRRPPRWVDDDDDDESKGMLKIVEKLMDQKMGGNADMLQQQRWEQERREHERRMDEERREREKREEEARARREEEKREYERRMEEREKEFQRQREEDQKRWEQQMETLRQQREEDRRAREQQEREAEARRREEELRRRDEEAARERERHQQELARIQKESEERATRERERFEEKLREQQRLAEDGRKEDGRQWSEARRDFEQKLLKIEEDRRRAEEQERRRGEEERRRHEEQLAAIREQNQKAEMAVLVEKLQQNTNTMMERFIAAQENRGDPVMAQMLSMQNESSARATEHQSQLLNTVLTQMTASSQRDEATRGEYMRTLLEIVNPERQMGGMNQISELMTKNVTFITELLRSGVLQQLGGQPQEGGWTQIVDKLVDAVGGGVEAVMAMRSEQEANQSAALRAAQQAAARPPMMPQGQMPVQQRPMQPMPQPRPMPQAQHPAAFSGPPAGVRRVQLPDTPQQPQQRQPVMPQPVAAVPDPQPTPVMQQPVAPQPTPQTPPQQPVAAEPMEAPAPGPGQDAAPLLKIRKLMATGGEPQEVAGFLYDYLSFLDRCEILPPETRQAVFGKPEEAVPRLLVTAVQLQDDPPVELTEEFVVAVIEEFVAILQEVGMAEELAAEEAAAGAGGNGEAEEEEVEEVEEEEEELEEEEEPPPLLAPADESEEAPAEPPQ
jgi:hypothetical protein